LTIVGGSIAAALLARYSALEAQGVTSDVVIADFARVGDQIEALVLNYAPTTAATIPFSNQELTSPPRVVSLLPIARLPQLDTALRAYSATPAC